MNNERSRKVLIVSASIGTGHMQAARAIEEYWKEKEPQASITHVDFLDTETMSVEHLIKGTYIKMIDVFPMLYDMIYRVSKGEKRGTIMQTALSYLLKSRMLKLVQQEEPDVMVFTHPFPCGAASILKRQGHIDVPLVAIMTDFSSHQFWLYPQIDTYYVATESMVDEMVAAGIDESRIHVSGIPVRRSFFRDAIEEYSLEKPVKVLVMGGGLGLGSLETALKHLDEVKDQFDYIIIDCPPSLGVLTTNALTAANSVIIPIQCEFFALEGVMQLLNTIILAQKNINPTLGIEGVLLTMLDCRTNLGLEVVEDIKSYFKESVYDTIIPRLIKLAEAPSHGKPIIAYAPDHIGAEAYLNLAKEVIARNGN